jgi:hypothetical protein
MSATTEITFKVRLTIFVALWLVAGLLWSTFADFSVEAGESEFAARAEMVYLAPLSAAVGLAFVLVPGGYNAWPGRQTWESGVTLGFLFAFLVHAVVTLTRKTRRAFIIWSAVQALFLVASVASVLYYWHWDALHMHG